MVLGKGVTALLQEKISDKDILGKMTAMSKCNFGIFF